MQTCSLCNATSPDQAAECVHCDVDLRENSTRAAALRGMRSNPRIRMVRVTVAHDSCSSCHELLRTYPKDRVPPLPHSGCSHPHGCRCFYEPVIGDLYAE